MVACILFSMAAPITTYFKDSLNEKTNSDTFVQYVLDIQNTSIKCLSYVLKNFG